METRVADDALAEAIDRIDEAWDGTLRSGSSFHSEAGDCLFVYSEGVAHYRERVDNALTVFRALAGGRIVGLQLKEVSQIPEHYHLHVDVSTKDGLPRNDVVTLLLLNLQRRAAGEGVEDPKTAAAYAEIVCSVATWSCGHHSHQEMGAEAQA